MNFRFKKLNFNKFQTIIFCSIIILGMGVLFAMYAFAITPKKYNLQIGQIAPTTIVAPRNIVDKLTTEKEKNIAAAHADLVYVANNKVNAEVLQNLNYVFSQLERIQKYGESLLGEQGKKELLSFSEEELEYAHSLLESIKLTDAQITTVLNISSESLLDLKNHMQYVLENVLKTSIREGNERESINYMVRFIGSKTDIVILQNIVEPVLAYVVKPNLIIDEKATEIARENAKNAVEDVVYQKGQNIVLEGNRIYPNQYQMIKDLGFLNDDTINVKLYIMLFLFIAMLMVTLVFILNILRPSILKDNIRFSFIVLTIVITSLFCILAKFINIYFAPILLAAFLSSCLVGTRSAIATTLITILLNVLLLFGSKESYDAEIPHLIIGNLISGIAIISILHKSQKRQSMLIAGTLAGIINFVLMIMFAIYSNTNLSLHFKNALASMASAYIATLLAMGLQPLFEYIFNMGSENKLLELSNPDHPLLKRLLIQAPGTYYHSMVVASLAEAAADAIGVNSLLTRVGAYYHDIGKLKSPEFFRENQGTDNPHDNLTPLESAEIVKAHVAYGLKLAKQYRLPRQIKDFIETHHGNSVVLYFYYEALKQEDSENIDINLFRYQYPKVRTKEQTIVMLSDIVEAAVRSKKDKLPDEILSLIHGLIDSKIQDNQLSESDLTMREINLIINSFISTLEATYHQRVEYPKFTIGK